MISITNMGDLIEERDHLRKECVVYMHDFNLCKKRMKAIKTMVESCRERIVELENEIETIENADEPTRDKMEICYLKEKLEMMLGYLWREVRDVGAGGLCEIFGRGTDASRFDSLVNAALRNTTAEQAENDGAIDELIFTLQLKEELKRRGVCVSLVVGECGIVAVYESKSIPSSAMMPAPS